MVTTPLPAARRTHRFGIAGLARDYALVLPGFFLSLCAFAVLVPLFSLAVGTLIVWIGALLLPVALTIASGFAQLSRARVRAWGLALPTVEYAPSAPGFSGWIRRVTDPRRWLDLAFEGLVAFPLRALTFSIAAAWTLGALAGLTYWFWGGFLPPDDVTLAGLILEGITAGATPDALAHSFALDAGFQLVAGVILLLTLPFVMRGLAWLEAATTAAALGAELEDPASADVPARPDRAAPRGAGLGTPARISAAGWSWICAGVAAVATIAVGWPVLAVLYGMPSVAAMLVSAAQAAAVLLVVRRPAVGTAVQTAAAVATALLASSSTEWPWPWPAAGIVIQSVIVLLVALRHPWPQALIAWLAPQAAVLLAVLPRVVGGAPEAAVAGLIVSASVTLGVAAVAAALRALASSRGALRAERRANADLSAQRRELDERTRIAQELHDVVAHSMSVISVQATTAEYRLPGLAPDVREEFASIAQSSRQALSEMRSLLVLLRSTDDEREAALAPQPTLDDIPALVDATRRSGAAISLGVSGIGSDAERHGAAAIPPAVGLTAYRVVQEALSNAVRHAPGSDIAVGVHARDDRLDVEVRNGPADPSGRREAAPGAGLGLSGVRERTQALGGTVAAGPVDGGGFRVRASLPLA